jgi:hypothetical protein
MMADKALSFIHQCWYNCASASFSNSKMRLEAGQERFLQNWCDDTRSPEHNSYHDDCTSKKLSIP